MEFDKKKEEKKMVVLISRLDWPPGFGFFQNYFLPDYESIIKERSSKNW